MSKILNLFKSKYKKSKMNPDNYIKLVNGYFDLDVNLRVKFDKYLNEASEQDKISEFFTYGEFAEIFKLTSYLFNLKFKESDIMMLHDKNDCWCTISEYINDDKGIVSNRYVACTPQELLDKIRINKERMIDVWNEIIID